jgi:hypothetical protein
VYKIQRALVGEKSAFVVGDLVGVLTFGGGTYEGTITGIWERVIGIDLGGTNSEETVFIKVDDIVIVGDL